MSDEENKCSRHIHICSGDGRQLLRFWATDVNDTRYAIPRQTHTSEIVHHHVISFGLMKKGMTQGPPIDVIASQVSYTFGWTCV